MFKRLRYLIIMGVLAKTLVDTTNQIYNPFIGIIGAGIGVSTVVMGRLISLRSLMGIAAPFLGSLADRLGYRAVMRICLALAGLGMILGALSGNLYIFGISMIIGGIGSVGFTPNLHAYLSTRLPYEKRAMGLGIIEYSWALAGIAGLFISGLLIDAFSWKTPFFFLGGGLIFMALFYGTLPSGKSGNKDNSKAAVKVPGETIAVRVKSFFDLGVNARSAWANISVSGLAMFAMMNIIIIHGGWLESEYGIGPKVLGIISLLFGLFDLTASVSVSLFVDRIGKRRSVIFGTLIMIFGFILFPFMNRGVVLAVIGIIIPRIGFEFAIVSNFSLLSEQVPEKRGQILGLGATFAYIGTSLAGLTGPVAYMKFGVWGLAPISLAAAVAALLLLIFVIREQSGFRLKV
ncbi:MAG: MFS transporter [Spirochaetales bacterium]|nr:MFS transporter [Spirochaetales bacterium]